MVNKKNGGSQASNDVTSLVSPENYELMDIRASNIVHDGGRTKKNKSKKGGSLASDAVVSLVTPKTFEIMDKTSTNFVGGKKKKSQKKKGGSQASDMVLEHVSPDTWIKLDQIQSNKVGGCNKKICKCKTGGCNCAKCKKLKRGGMQLPTLSSILHGDVFKESPAMATPQPTSPKVGGSNVPMSELQESVDGINNAKGGKKVKKGGSPTTLNYSAIKSTGNVYPSDYSGMTATKILANDSYQSVPAYNPITQYGSVTDSSPYFSYSLNNSVSSEATVGGGKKKTTKKVMKEKKKTHGKRA